MCCVAAHPGGVDASTFPVVNLCDACCGDRELSSLDELVDPVGSPLVQGVVYGSQKDLLRGELIVGLIGDELFEPGSDVGHPQRPELLVLSSREHLTLTVPAAGSSRPHGHTPQNDRQLRRQRASPWWLPP